VTGYRLDDAHNRLEDAGFEKFADDDAVSDRTPAWDANWVVVKQSPAAGDSAELGTTIQLSIAKPEDEGVRQDLPAGSPVAIELREQDKERAAEQRQEQAERIVQNKKDRAAVTEFVEQNDPMSRNSLNAIAELPSLADSIRAKGVVTISDSATLADIDASLRVYWETLEATPESVNECADRTQEAIRSFQQAADTLQTAEGAAAQSSLTRFSQIYQPAKNKYNSGLTCLYQDTGIDAPTLP
jgi:hypothetical protein